MINKEYNKRTNSQRKALQVLCDNASSLCNEHGIDLPLLLARYRIQVTPEIIKDIIRETGRVKFNKESTADLTTKELQACFEEFRQNLIDISGGMITVEFP